MAELRVNEQIKVPTVRLVGVDGQQLGVVPTARAIALARSEGYDLIEVAPQAVPPVSKIGDYGKYRYEQQQREKEAKKKQRTINWKEVRVAPKIDDHDLATKIRTAARLLDHGDKLKLVVRFRGRELAHPDRGRTLLMDMAEKLKDHGFIERPPLLEGRQMLMVMEPKRAQAPGKPAGPETPPQTKPVTPVPAGPRPAPGPAPAASAAPRPAATPARPAPAPSPARPASAPSTAPRTAATRAPRAS